MTTMSSQTSQIKGLKSMTSYPSSQKGVALVVVLLFLVLIMLAGVMAVRQSNTDLKTATSDQINATLLQSSDSAQQRIESMVNKPIGDEYRDIMSMSGMFGHFLSSPDNIGNEYIYCYNPRDQKYSTQYATIYQTGGGIWSGIDNGICDYKNNASYTSGRETTMTQVNVTTKPNDPDEPPFTNQTIGKEVGDRTSKKFTFDIRATSALPAYSDPVYGGESCFKQSTNMYNLNGTRTLLECLNSANTPSKMVLQQVDLENNSTGVKCVGFGTQALTAEEAQKALDAQCVLRAAGSP